jgi:carboxymethylenebutenolidase
MLTLTASDGNVLMAHECRAGKPTGAGVVVMPDIRGLHAYYRDLTVRLAEVGLDAVAIDYFGRTADSDDRSDSFPCMEHVAQGTPEGMAADVAAGVAHLKGLGVERVFTLGFCLGGGFSWRQSADTPGLAGCIGFYGRSMQGLQVVDRMTAPLLMLIAGGDSFIPVEDPLSLAEAATVETQVHVFDGLEHSFFDRTSPDNAEACDTAWSLIQDFVARH